MKYQVQPTAYGPLQAAHDAFLLIGNQALRQRSGAPGFPYTYDLGAEWHAWTGLPFVFARWMVRKEVAAKDKALLEETLYVGLEDGVEALYQVAAPREDLFMLPRDIVTIQGFRYYTGKSEQQAIEQFQRAHNSSTADSLITGHDNDVFHTENAHAFSGLVIEQAVYVDFPLETTKARGEVFAHNQWC